MRQFASGTTLALALTGATVLATAATSTAYACAENLPAPTTTLQATVLDLHTPLNADVYHAFLDAKLDRLGAYVTALRAKVAAIPAGTVLTGAERLAAKARLAKAEYLTRLLAAIPATGQYAPTAVESNRIAAIKAGLAAIVAKLRTLLANRPAVVAPTSTTVVTRPFKVLGERHQCDGFHDGAWSWWGSWDHHRR